jgi:3-methyladenine DNA glycosylase Tag
MRSIALTGAEAAAAVNTAIVRLQLLDEVGDTVRVRWDPSASVSPEGISGAQRRSMEARWMLEHTSQLGGRFDLLEPLLAGRAAVMQAVGMVNDHRIDCFRHQEVQ